jgi:hypothetical protein
VNIAKLVPVVMGRAIPAETLPWNMLSNAGAIVEDFESLTGFAASGTGASIALDAANYKTGTKSIQLTTGSGVLGRISRTGVSWDLSTWGDDIRLWFYVADAATITAGGIQIVLATDGTLTKNFNVYIYAHAGWNLVNLRKVDFTVTGGMTWTDTVTLMRLNVTPVAGQVGVISFDSLTAAVVQRPALMITFDDADPTVYTQAFAYMKPHKIPGTFYVITNNIDDVGTITSAQLVEMDAAGWIIGNHTDDHSTLSGLDQATQQGHLSAAKTALEGLGLTRGEYHAAYPGGSYDANTSPAMLAESMLTGRTVGAARYPVLPQDDFYKIQLGKQFGNTLTLAAAKTWLDGVVSRCEVGIALFHQIITPASNASQWPIADFQAFIDYVVAQHIPCITMADFYALNSGPVTVKKVA